MTREERCILAVEKGYTYNPETGIIYGIRNNNKIDKIIHGYIVMSVSKDNKQYMLSGHQFAYYWVYKKTVNCIDHINGIKHDNRIYNLREVTNQQNSFNTIAKGYYYDKDNSKYRAQIMLNSKTIYLGLYNTEDDARQAYLTAKEKYHLI